MGLQSPGLPWAPCTGCGRRGRALTLQGGVSGDCKGQRRPLTILPGFQGPGQSPISPPGSRLGDLCPGAACECAKPRGRHFGGSLMADVQAAALTHPGCREKTSAAQGTLLAPRLRSTATRAACRVSLFLSEPLGRSLSERRRLFLLHHPLLTSLKDHTE